MKKEMQNAEKEQTKVEEDAAKQNKIKQNDNGNKEKFSNTICIRKPC